jgi:hypothetical protein
MFIKWDARLKITKHCNTKRIMISFMLLVSEVVFDMVQILENPKMMTKDEIDVEFDGKWVYIVRAIFTNSKGLVEGMPVIIADKPFEGNENGIYEQFDSEEFEIRYARNLKHYAPFIPSVFAVEFVQ